MSRRPKYNQEDQARLDALTAQAEELGASAFHANKMAVPAHDGRVMVLIAQAGARPGLAIVILDAWSRAWHRENLR